jgi:hypothetical protein
VKPPPITITCDCGATTEAAYGERWVCPTCGKAWNTAQIPSADYDHLVRGVSRYRWLVLGPPLVLAAILIPLAIVVGIQFAFLLFVLVMAWGLLAVPQLRRRTAAHIRDSTKSWKLRPD